MGRQLNPNINLEARRYMESMQVGAFPIVLVLTYYVPMIRSRVFWQRLKLPDWFIDKKWGTHFVEAITRGMVDKPRFQAVYHGDHEIPIWLRSIQGHSGPPVDINSREVVILKSPELYPEAHHVTWITYNDSIKAQGIVPGRVRFHDGGNSSQRAEVYMSISPNFKPKLS